MVHFKCGGLERAAKQICKRFFWKATVLQIRKFFLSIYPYIFIHIFITCLFILCWQPSFLFYFSEIELPVDLALLTLIFPTYSHVAVIFFIYFWLFWAYACCGEYTIIKSGYNSVIYITHIFGGNKIPLDSIHWVGLHIMK